MYINNDYNDDNDNKEMTREQLAANADITTKFLYEVENGKKGLSATTLLKIANALSCSCDYIFFNVINCFHLKLHIPHIHRNLR